MRTFKHSLIIILFFISLSSSAQSPEVVIDYINTYRDIAIKEMQRTGVPASITLAQGIHESTAGTSILVQQSNNHFGIKCKTNWTGESVKHDDDARAECFRKYAVALDSYKDHSDFLKNSGRYAFLFQLDPADYEGWANGLKKAGYATNPKYPLILIKLVKDYNLQDYTMIALGKSPSTDVAVADPVIITAEPVTEEIIKPKSIYPQGLFLINETRVIYANKGTSFLAIAKQYGVDLARIFEFNEMPEMEAVDKDQLIYLQRKRKTGNDEFHIVQPGESMHDIAQIQAIRLESLLAHNWLKNDEIPAIGEQLSLKKNSPAVIKLAVKTNYSILPGMK